MYGVLWLVKKNVYVYLFMFYWSELLYSFNIFGKEVNKYSFFVCLVGEMELVFG